MGFVAVGPYS